MNLTEGIIQHAAKAVKGDGPIDYQGTEIRINEPFKRVHMVDAIKEVTGVDFWPEMTVEEAIALAKEKQVPLENTSQVSDISSMLSSRNLLKKPWSNQPLCLVILLKYRLWLRRIQKIPASPTASNFSS